jgi:hypothetical protein
MLTLAARLVDTVVCVSHAQAAWFSRAAHIARGKLGVIQPYAVNPGLTALALPDHPQDRPIRIGAYRRFSGQRGFDTLVKAYRAG